MKRITKDEKGITLIALITTVVIMVILLSVSTYTGIDTYKASKVNKFVIEMQLIQSKIDDLVATNTIEELNNMELPSVTTQEQIDAITTAFEQKEIVTADKNKYKVFTKDKILEILDIEDVQNDIMVNFETREVVSAGGVKNDGITYYTQYKLPGGQTIINNNTKTERELSMKLNMSVDGLNATVTISSDKLTNGTLNYKEENSDYWITITNYTEKGKEYIVNISKNGNYTFKLQDNLNIQEFIEKELSVTLTNKPKTKSKIENYNYNATSEKWAYSTKDSLNYVWVPRLAYDSAGNIKFIKGNSNVATDNTYIGDEWSVHNKFTTEKGVELTGIWISVSNIKQGGLSLLTLLNDDTRTMLIEI